MLDLPNSQHLDLQRSRSLLLTDLGLVSDRLGMSECKKSTVRPKSAIEGGICVSSLCNYMARAYIRRVGTTKLERHVS